MKNRTLIYNAHLVDSTFDKKNAAILIENASIAGFPTRAAAQKMLEDKSIKCFDAKGSVVLPSFIDMHAHFRDPGQTQKEDIDSGSQAAAAAGFGTVVLMPNTTPPVSSLELAKDNNLKAKKRALTQVIQAVSITKNFDGKTLSHLEKLDRHVVPLITEDGHEVEDSAVMLQAMKIAAKKKLIVSCHCEDPFLAARAKPLRKAAQELLGKGQSKENKQKAIKLLLEANTLLRLAEDCATDRNILLAEEAGCHVHLCHVSTAHSIQSALAAKKRGVHITFEVTPHHLALSGQTAPHIFDIVNPPLRSEGDRLAVLNALFDGTADVIATDHAPHTAQDKKNGAPGFSGLETAFALCHTELCVKHNMPLRTLSALMSEHPAAVLGLKKCGLLREGFDANVVIVNPEKTWVVRGEHFKSRGTYTPLEGKKLTGLVEATFFKGNLVYERS